MDVQTKVLLVVAAKISPMVKNNMVLNKTVRELHKVIMHNCRFLLDKVGLT